MSYYCTSGNAKTLPKPRKPLAVDRPDSTKLYMHAGESSDWALQETNFLASMWKLLPTWEQAGDAGEPTENFSKALTEFGDGSSDQTPQNGFSDWNRALSPAGGGLPWGFYEGQGAQNLNYHPGISENILFNNDNPKDKSQQALYKRMEDAGVGNPYSVKEYKDLTGLDVKSYEDIWNSAKTCNGVQVLGGGVNQALQSYGDKSYYQIVMSGYGEGSNGVYSYDGKEGANGEGAFKLMIGLLETRRRIFGPMTELFGSNRLIGNTSGGKASPKDKDLISAFDSWMKDPKRGGGADVHNMAIFSLFLESQESLHSVLPAYSFDPNQYHYDANDPSGGLPGWIKSERDRTAFLRFSNWMYTNLNTYKNYLSSKTSGNNDLKNYSDKVNSLIDEFYGRGSYDTQPYINTSKGDTAGGKRAGWDDYSAGWGSGTPSNANPIASGEEASSFIGQLTGISMCNRTGNVYDSHGNLVTAAKDLMTKNWAVSDYFKLLSFGDKDMGRNISISTKSRSDRAQYQKDMREYFDKRDELSQDEAMDQARVGKAAAESRARLQQMMQKAIAESRARMAAIMQAGNSNSNNNRKKK